MRWIWIWDSNSSVLISCSLPKYVSPAPATSTSMSPSSLGGPVHETLHRVRVGDVEGKCDRLTAVGADLVDELLALLDAAGAERHRKAMRCQLDVRWPRRCPTRRRRRSRAGGRGGVRNGASRPVFTVIGQVGEPAHITGVDADRIGLVDLDIRGSA